MKTYIYTLKHPETNEIRYVGKTTNIKRRYYQHTNKKICKKLSNKYLSNWLLSILNKDLKPILNIIEECEDNWVESEVYWIEQFKIWGFNLINITRGGEGFGYKHSEESKKKMSLAQKGLKKNFTEKGLKSHIKRMKENNPMKNQDVLNKRKNKPIVRSKDFSEICKKRHAKLLATGFRANTKKVINTETGQIFNTVKEAAGFLNITRTHLILCLKNKRKNLTKMIYYEEYNS